MLGFCSGGFCDFLFVLSYANMATSTFLFLSAFTICTFFSNVTNVLNCHIYVFNNQRGGACVFIWYFCIHYLTFFHSSPCGKDILLGGNCLLPAISFSQWQFGLFLPQQNGARWSSNRWWWFHGSTTAESGNWTAKRGRRGNCPHTLFLLHMLLVATSSFAVVCHELKFHDSENMATTNHLSIFCRRRNVLATGPPRNGWLHWLTDLLTIRRELLLRWVCRLWWMSGARI